MRNDDHDARDLACGPVLLIVLARRSFLPLRDPVGAHARGRATQLVAAPLPQKPIPRLPSFDVPGCWKRCQEPNLNLVPDTFFPSVYLFGLAMAHAEAGDFDAAVKWQTKAMDLTAGRMGQTQLELYRQGQPYRTTWR
jgi:hypothetical protein